MVAFRFRLGLEVAQFGRRLKVDRECGARLELPVYEELLEVEVGLEIELQIQIEAQSWARIGAEIGRKLAEGRWLVLIRVLALEVAGLGLDAEDGELDDRHDDAYRGAQLAHDRLARLEAAETLAGAAQATLGGAQEEQNGSVDGESVGRELS